VSANARPIKLILVAGALVGFIAMLSGCAATTPGSFVEEPGVTVRIALTSGGTISGTLIGMEEGVLIVDRSVPKSSNVTVRIALTSGGAISGTLIGMEEGVLIVDRSVPKSSNVTVVRRDGVDIVYLDGIPIGTAMEIRDVDIVVRERRAFFEIDDVRVVSGAYFGWGTAIAAVLAFLMVRVLQDM